MHKRTLIVGMFLLAMLFLIGVIGLTAEATVTVDDTEKTITLTTDSYTLDSIWANDSVGNANLTNVTDGTWMANYSIIITGGATLELSPTAGSTGCTWLKLNTKNETGKFNAYILVQDGNLWVNDTMITAWNHTGGLADGNNNTCWTAFRPYIYIYSSTATPRAYFLNSTIGYLGYDIDNKYGIVYEDAEGGEPWGWMHNCTVLESFHGINFQGCENMNVTNTWMNHTKEAGIVYTISETGGGSHGGFVGDHSSWTHRATYDSVAVDYCSGDLTAMGIRLLSSDNISFNNVNIQDASNHGLRVESCNILTVNYTTSYLNTNSADDYNIFLYNCTNSTFTNCTAYTPDGVADGGNWMLTGGGGNNSHHNNFTECRGYGATSSYDFHVWHSDGNIFTNCYANNSAFGYYVERGHNNSFIDCEARTHVSYNFKIYGSHYNEIAGGYANSSAIGILISDDTDAHVSHHNEILGMDINSATSYAISIGTDDGTDNICHNNTATNVIVTGTTTGDGIFLFDNVTYNNISGCAVLDLTPSTSGGMGVTDWADYNTFYNCSSMSNAGIGYYLLGHANHNAITSCEASGNLIGIRVTDYANNNTVNHSDFNNNTWIGIWVSADSASSGDNEFWISTCHDNVWGIYIEDTPLVSFTEVDAYNNSQYGVIVTNSSSTYFFNCIVDNPIVAQYDWYVDNTSTADIYSPYILFGFDENINYQYDTTQPYGVSAHDTGGGVWALNTSQMTVHCQDENTTYVNLTYWSATRIKWTANSTTGTEVYQKIGGLVPGTRYDLIVGGDTQSINTSVSGTMLTTHGTTGYVWFNYTGSWSAVNFEVKKHVVADGGNGGGANGVPSGDEDTDGDGLSDEFEETIGTDPLLPDTDGDGYTDYEEYIAGTDPLDATDYPGIISISGSFLFIPIIFWLFIVIPVIVAFLVFFLYCDKRKEKERKRCQVFLFLALALLAIIGIVLYFLL